jgi:hypothetical protein
VLLVRGERARRFCRQCGAEFVATAELDLAILLKCYRAPLLMGIKSLWAMAIAMVTSGQQRCDGHPRRARWIRMAEGHRNGAERTL